MCGGLYHGGQRGYPRSADLREQEHPNATGCDDPKPTEALNSITCAM